MFGKTRLKLLAIFMVAFPSLTGAAAEQERKVLVGGENYAPYADETLPEKGWMWAVASAAFEHAGYESEFVAGPWKRALELGKVGEAWQAIYPAYITDERQQYYVFSEAIALSALGLFRLKKRTDIHYSTNLDKLQMYKIGVCRGCLISEAFDAATSLDKMEVADTKLAIQMLLRGRIDMMAGNMFTDTHKIAVLSNSGDIAPDAMTRIEFLKPALAWNPLFMAFSKQVPNHMALRDAFNAGLQELVVSGELQNILDRHTVDKSFVPLLKGSY